LGAGFSYVGGAETSTRRAGLIKVCDKAAATESAIYLVQFADPPLALYRGGLRNLAATAVAVTGSRKLDVRSRAALVYRQYLTDRRKVVEQTMVKVLARPLLSRFRYEVVFNGLAVELTRAEAEKVRRLPGVISVQAEKMSFLHTDAGPQWIGADKLWDDPLFIDGIKGEGMVVGVIDTGINPHNPSFADIGGDGYDHSNPRGIYYGICNPLHPDYDAAFCNDKLIGAYDLTPEISGNLKTALDVSGHGSHTASTAAGNVLPDALIEAPTLAITRAISGVAPHANIISYRVCYPDDVQGGGCPGSALVAAIEQAVSDQVDVINYSIGGLASDPWSDPESLAFLAAREAGIMVATSAGNEGPEAETIGAPAVAPWLLAVGASTHDRELQNRMGNFSNSTGPQILSFIGPSFTAGYGQADLVYAGNPPYNDALALGPFAPGTFNGEIVVCDRGEIARVDKGANLLAGGAGGMVLLNSITDGDSLVCDMHYLPAIHLTYSDGLVLKNWLAGSFSPRGTICGTTLAVGVGDLMASFSSRGADPAVPDIIKPDVTAPGVSILAAGGSDPAQPYGVNMWELMSGTSMASPHAAGAALLLHQAEPGWSPAEIQSALMTTAVDDGVLLDDGLTPADPFARGSGRISLPEALAAGFVMDISAAEYSAADPARGGSPAALNLPGFAAAQVIGSQTWERTIKSTLAGDETWQSSVTAPPGVSLQVAPSSFTLAAGGSQTLTLTAEVSGAAAATWLFGELRLTPASPAVPVAHLPIALKSLNSNLTRSLVIENAELSGREVISDIKASAIEELYPRYYGLVEPRIEEAALIQNPVPGEISLASEPAPNPLTEGVLRVVQNVPLGSKRLLAEIVAASAPDLDLYIYFKTGGEMVAISAGSGSVEKCSLLDPAPGEYWIYVDNFQASDPSGSTPDTVTLAVAQVPSAGSADLQVVISGGGAAPPAGEPFNLDVVWDLTARAAPGDYWYGAFDLGGSAATPGNLGTVTVDLYRCRGGSIRVLPPATVYTESLTAVYEYAVIAGDTLQLRAGNFAGELNFTRNIVLTLSGGYDCAFAQVIGTSTLKGSLTLAAGSLTVENIILEAAE
ncbi:MAG: S8 family serine peptidase, partial [Deltaproteobacteria bacterium]|nr:S8 family serine peptidase [Deltaproteobacteria bacterium]